MIEDTPTEVETRPPGTTLLKTKGVYKEEHFDHLCSKICLSSTRTTTTNHQISDPQRSLKPTKPICLFTRTTTTMKFSTSLITSFTLLFSTTFALPVSLQISTSSCVTVILISITAYNPTRRYRIHSRRGFHRRRIRPCSGRARSRRRRGRRCR